MSDDWTLTPTEEAAMDAATAALIEQLTIDGRFATLSLLKITGALASQASGYYSATQPRFTSADNEAFQKLKVRHFTAGVDQGAVRLDVIGSA